MQECKNCKYYVGDCGHHHKDSNKHINYDIPAEYMYERGVITCFKPSDSYIATLDLKYAEEIATEYSIEVIERALEIKKGE